MWKSAIFLIFTLLIVPFISFKFDNSLTELREVLFAEYPTFASIDHAPGGAEGLDLSGLGKAGDVDAAAFVSPVSDFYMTNPIARASTVMAECSALGDGNAVKEAAE